MKKHLLAFISLAVLATACTSAGAVAPAPSQDPTPTPTVAVTPRPTPVPTPSATPTPEPEDEVIEDDEPIVNLDAEKFLAFTERSIEYFDDSEYPLGLVEIDLDYVEFSFGRSGLVKDAKALQKVATSYIKWLNANPPAACFKTQWTLDKNAATKVSQGMTKWIKFGKTNKVTYLTQGTTLIKQATKLTNKANADLAKINCY